MVIEKITLGDLEKKLDELVMGKNLKSIFRHMTRCDPFTTAIDTSLGERLSTDRLGVDTFEVYSLQDKETNRDRLLALGPLYSVISTRRGLKKKRVSFSNYTNRKSNVFLGMLLHTCTDEQSPIVEAYAGVGLDSYISMDTQKTLAENLITQPTLWPWADGDIHHLNAPDIKPAMCFTGNADCDLTTLCVRAIATTIYRDILSFYHHDKGEVTHRYTDYNSPEITITARATGKFCL